MRYSKDRQKKITCVRKVDTFPPSRLAYFFCAVWASFCLELSHFLAVAFTVFNTNAAIQMNGYPPLGQTQDVLT
jgi:hypothetical protein